MPYEYNPLFKDGLQKVSNGSGDNSQKVTKFFAATDNLEDGEIAQYQGEDDLSNNLIKGYFYQKTGSQQELPAGTQFFNNIETTVNLYGYNVKPGNFFVKENKTPTSGSNFFNYILYRFENFWNYQFLTLNDARPDVGDILFDTNNNTIVTVLQVTFDSQFRTNYILSDGTTIVLTARTGHAFNALYTFIDNDLNIYTIADCRELNSWVFLHYSLSDNTFNIIDWFSIPYELLQTTSESVIIGNNVFQRTDTQPDNSYTLPIATSNILGGVIIGSGLSIDANGVLSASGGGSSTPHIYRCVVITTAPNYVTALSYSAFVFNNLLFINGLFNILDTPSGNFLRVVYDDEESDIFTIKFLESFPYDANFINVDDNNLMSNIGGFARTNAGSDTLQSDNGSFPVGMASFNVVIPIAITVQS